MLYTQQVIRMHLKDCEEVTARLHFEKFPLAAGCLMASLEAGSGARQSHRRATSSKGLHSGSQCRHAEGERGLKSFRKKI